MNKEALERIKTAYYSGLKVQIWFAGYWEDFDVRDYSMYEDPFSKNRQYRIVGDDYADKAEKRIVELEKENATLKEKHKDLEWQLREVAKDNDVYQKQNKELEKQIEKMKSYLNEFMRISVASVEEFEPEFSELVGEVETFLEK